MTIRQYIKNLVWLNHKKPLTFMIGNGLALMVALSSCANEDLKGKPNDNQGSQFYTISFTTKFENSKHTRSYTTDEGDSDSGNLNAFEKESQINDADLFFFDADYTNIIAHFKEFEGKVNSDGSKTFTMTFAYEELSKFAQECHLLVVANMDRVGKTAISSPMDETFSVATLRSLPIGDFGEDGKGKLLPLVSSSDFVIDFSYLKDESEENKLKEIVKFFDEDNNLDLTEGTEGVGGEEYIFEGKGTLDLERAVARIDWSDNPQRTDNKPNIYTIRDTSVDVKLHSLQLFNVNTESYLFRHTALGEESTLAADQEQVLFGVENNDETGATYNWVAGPDWGMFSAGYTKSGSFLNPFSNGSLSVSDATSPGLITISELTKTKEDNTTVRPLDEDEYYPWHYITENTLPSIATDPSTNATGVAFTFKIMNGDNPLKPGDFDEENFSLSNITKIPDKIDEDNTWIRITDNQGYYVRVKYTEVKDDEDNLDEENSGYFITYYAYIIHNNSEDYRDQKLPPMYYGVVRNNVYQIYVKSITSIPTPNAPSGFSIDIDVQTGNWGLRTDEDVILK